jgi:hypothetical protein
MKKVKFISIIAAAILWVNISSLQAQTTEGKNFWLTFGKNYWDAPYEPAEMYIRIVSGNNTTTGSIVFSEGTSASIPFSILPQQVFTVKLNSAQKQSVYNTTMGKSNKSVYISSNENVSVYIMNQLYAATDATNVFPVATLGTDYYAISYTVSYGVMDAYAVIATEDNTTVEHAGTFLSTLNAGQVYYRTQYSDMTGTRITSNKPIAFFSLPQGNNIPSSPSFYCCADLLMQQLAPVNTWGKNFFVPVSHLGKDRVRIVASVNGTNITQNGGTLVSSEGSQMSLNNLQAGQFVELDINIVDNGCYITADFPVGVCTYLTGFQYHGGFNSDPAQSWLSPLEQKVPGSLIAPFKPDGSTLIQDHRAIVVTETATKNDTKVSVGGGTLTGLTGGSWIDHVASGMSYYTMPLVNGNVSYYYTNNKGIVILCYGAGEAESYYYLAGSAMRDLDAAFYANDIPYQILKENPICAGNVDFRAEIEGLHPTHHERLTWWINGTEYLPAKNLEQWSKPFTVGEYEIEMKVRYENDETTSKTGTLIIKSCNQSATFYKNDVHYLTDTTFCNKNVSFRADIEGLHPTASDKIRWYVDGVEETSELNLTEWGKPFENGTYEIKMIAHYDNDVIVERIGTLKIQAWWIKMRNIRY